MADARSSLNEKDYFTRVFFALTDCGRRVLLHLLQRRVRELTPKDHQSQPWSLDEFLHHNKAAILLPTGRVSRHKNILYPFKQDTDLTKWDIPLFVFVLLEACKLNDNGDLHRQLRQDIDNLKSLRNIMVNSATPTLKEEFYHMYFGRIVGAVQRICDYMQEPGLKESLSKELDKYERLTHIDYEDQMNVYDVDICLRGYQQELAKEGCEGENVIVIAPPNSGKTRVACRIMQLHLRQKKEERKRGRVLLLVENEAQAIQQRNVCKELLPNYRTKVFSGTVHRLKKQMLWDFLEIRDIFVVTAQIFLYGLRAEKIESVGVFSLIVFDECHHSNKQDMYNEIMSRYINIKLWGNVYSSQLPQIVGLTSSLGVGGRTEWDQGLNHMKKLMANMDAKFLCTVKTPLTIVELKKFVNPPVEELLPVQGRDVDWFKNAVGEIAKRIDAHMAQHQIVRSAPPGDEFIQTKCRLPKTFGTEKYLQLNAEFATNIAKVGSKDIRRVLNPCRLHLEAYNKALMIHRDATKRDAFVSLEEFMEDFRVVPAEHPTDAFIMALYDELREISSDTEPDNPKLLKLKEILTRVLCNDQNARGIIFVRTRELAQALVRWVNETDSLDVLNAAELVGQSDSASVGENSRQVVFVVHATADQEYAESLCKYLEDKGYVCIQSGNDYQPLDRHEKSLNDIITITNKTLIIVTANSLQQFTEIIRNVLSKSAELKDDKISVLLSFLNGYEIAQFWNELCELIPFEILQMDVTTVADVRRFKTSVFKRGVKKSGQKDVLEFFKNKQHRLLIATSVAEEGLDISKCSLVIRYEHVTDEIIRLQSRGRARAENSLFYVIAEEGSWILEKEEKNRRCEELMNQIVSHLQVFVEDHTGIWERELLEIQEKMKQEEERQVEERVLHMAAAGGRF